VLHRLGYRFRLHRADLPGCPEVVLPRWRLALFIVDCGRHPHGDCTRADRPRAAVAGDAEARRLEQAVAALERQGWQTLIVQACDTDDLETLSYRLDIALQGHLIAHEGETADGHDHECAADPEARPDGVA
jgi:DNA mismatch endonuclease (patch repair protein)